MGTCLSIATPGPSGRKRNGSEAAATKHTNNSKKKVKTAQKTKGSRTARNTTTRKLSTAAASGDSNQNQNPARLRVASWNVNTKNKDYDEKKKIICKTIRKQKYTWHHNTLLLLIRFYVNIMHFFTSCRLDLIGFQELVFDENNPNDELKNVTWAGARSTIIFITWQWLESW